jgi:hypothetical protein
MPTIHPTIHITNFVRRQTPQSGYSHWTLTDEQLLARVQANFHKATQGYREGVLLVPLEPGGFFTSTIILEEGDKFVGEYVARQKGEEPRKSNYVVSNRHGESLGKQEAVKVYAVLYSHAVLLEGKENDTDADFEIVSINASPTDEEAPIPMGALIANHFQLSGGTATNMSDSDFVALLRKSVVYWKNKSQVCPEHLKQPKVYDLNVVETPLNLIFFLNEQIASLLKRNEDLDDDGLSGQIDAFEAVKTFLQGDA